MKKITIFVVILMLLQISADARDYTKLQTKEIKHAQKYGTTNKILAAPRTQGNIQNLHIKDPKLIKLGNYEVISESKYKEKLAKDDTDYAKIDKNFIKSKTDNYHRQAYAEDFYRLYRLCEKIIRANNLEFIDWRITVQSKQDFNAYNSDMNNITINTGLYDTFAGNDDAMAFIVGHEMGHALLGHRARKSRLEKKIEKASRLGSALAYTINTKRYLIESKNMEYAADVEGAKLAAKAGFNLTKAREAITFMSTLDDGSMERHSTHPNAEHRLNNYDQNSKYFPLDEWLIQGKYNIYNSNVLNCQKSSDRKSIVIRRGDSKSVSDFYRPETVEDLYKRYGYMSYINGEFKDSIKYFKKALDENKGDYAVYLYISYAYEYLGDKDSSIEFAEYARRLNPDNKYVKEQIQAL